MRDRHWRRLAVAAGFIVAAGGAWAQSAPPQSAEQNVRESRQYEQLLCTNPSFRAKRIAQECGPLQGSQFYQGCVASFDCKQQPSAAQWRKKPASEKIR